MCTFCSFFLNYRSINRKRGLGVGNGDTYNQAEAKKRAYQKRERQKKYYQKNKEKIKQCRMKYIAQKKYTGGNGLHSQRNNYFRQYYQTNQERLRSKGKTSKGKKKENTKSFEYIGRLRIENFDEGAVIENNIGEMEYVCWECGALMFKDEAHRYIHKGSNEICFSMCCSYGHVKVSPISEPPNLLKTLLLGNSSRSHHFLRNIRAYNSAFAFASMTLTGHEYQFHGKGPYCFRINGQIYHKISQLLPEPGQEHKFSQIYLYDAATEVNTRMNLFSNLQQKIMQELQHIINRVNPYAALYHGVRDLLNDSPATDVTLVLKASGDGIDHRRYNVPTGTDIAMVIPVENENQPLNKNIVIYKTKDHHPSKNNLMTIDHKNPMYDPLLYVLMFPYGDKGWELNLTCSCLQYYCYRLMVRSKNTFNIVHRMGHLFQQYIVDMYSKIEAARLTFIRCHQSKLRAEVYQGLSDAIQGCDGNVDGSQLGKRVILPSSFTGSACYQHQLYQDAMAIVRRFGKPDLFITFTCNPQWPEITHALFQNQTSADRPDIVARVFKLKLKCLLHDIYYKPKPIFGKMFAIIYVIEWQK